MILEEVKIGALQDKTSREPVGLSFDRKTTILGETFIAMKIAATERAFEKPSTLSEAAQFLGLFYGGREKVVAFMNASQDLFMYRWPKLGRTEREIVFAHKVSRRSKIVVFFGRRWKPGVGPAFV